MPAATVARRTRTRKPKATKAPERDYLSIAEGFEADVLSGRFSAGALFRAAVERQRRDRAAPPEGYTFQAETGDKFCRRAERFPFGGEGPERGTPFMLQPWQVWLFHTLFSWRDSVTGAARFRTASIWLPKGNGKSPIAALMALSVLIGGRGGEKVYSAASTQKQARWVFDGAREMLQLDKDAAVSEGRKSIADHFGLVVEEHKIKGAEDNRTYEPVSSEAGSIEGIRPTLVILDEVHVQPNRKLYDNLKSATNKVDGSLLVTISTAGFDMSPESIGWQLYSRAREILEQKKDDPTLFAFIVEADRKRPDGTAAEPTDFDVWRQANPNLGVSVSIAGLRSAIQTWRDVPSERASLETKHLGWWQQTASAFIDVRQWNALAVPGLKIDDVRAEDGWKVTLGADLARTRDLTALPVVAARPRADGKHEYRIFTRHVYLPEESPTVTAEFRQWAKDGWIELTPGPTMSFRPLKEAAIGIAKRFPGLEACFDDHMAAEVEQDLMAEGLTVVSIRQGARTQSEPMKELEAAILDGRIQHDGSPVAAMCLGNLTSRADRNGNVAPDRENEYKKIDIGVAIINAFVRARAVDDNVFQPVDGGFASL